MLSMEPLVLTEFEAGVGRITINRPDKRNSLTRELIEHLDQAVEQMRVRPELRVLVLAASGGVFCAGMDLGEMQARAISENGQQEWLVDSRLYSQLLQKIYTMRVPTIARLQGPVLAGGVGMVLACDLILASTNTFFSLPEPMRGITAAIVTPLLVLRLGPGAANHLLLSGERMSAERAWQLGLCYDVVAADQLEEREDQLLASILTGSPAALEATKQHLSKIISVSVTDQLEDSIRVSAQARQSVDAREGLAAFLEKRKPNWQPD
jgi:methylglutaconyl-CoA hydratase